MLSKKLIGAWAFFDFCLMAAGVLSLTLSILWRRPNLLLNLTFSNLDLTCTYYTCLDAGHSLLKAAFPAGTVLGIVLLATFVLSLLVVMQRGTSGLKILNWALLSNGIIILLIGTYIWIFTLHERNNYHAIFGGENNDTKILIQDTVRRYFGLRFLIILTSLCSIAEVLWLFQRC